MTDAPTPLPGGWADELLWHLRECPRCRVAKLSANPSDKYCDRGEELIRLTMKERHG